MRVLANLLGNTGAYRVRQDVQRLLSPHRNR
jgi:hypothetical protein